MLTQQDFVDGGVMYWRVAVVDPDGNVGAFSKAKKFTLLARMQVQLAGQPPHGQRGVGHRHRAERQGQADQGRRRQAPRAPASRPGRKRTNKKGIVTFSVKPTQRRQPHGHRDQEALQGRHDGRRRSRRPCGVPGRAARHPGVARTATMAAVSVPETAETKAETRGDEIRTADLVATALTRYAQAFATFGLMALVAAAFPALVVIALRERGRRRRGRS